MFGMGMPEILLILAIALIVIGPKKLPEIAKAMGKAMGEFKRATNDIKNTINADLPDRDFKTIDVTPAPPKPTMSTEDVLKSSESDDDASPYEPPGEDKHD